MKRIRIFVEGGGHGSNTKAVFREGFSHFLRHIREKAREQRIEWQVIVCGSRSDTHRIFRTAPAKGADTFDILLVDAERPVTGSVREHLSAATEDNWDLSDAADDQLHLMAQVMESWFLADVEALRGFYGKDFSDRALRRTHNVETVPKADVESRLNAATRQTKPGAYHKTRHAPELLKRIDPARVRAASTHCERLFTVLEDKAGGGA